MGMSELPKGWAETTLGEVATFQRGFDLPKKDRCDGNYPLMVSNGQDGTHNNYKVKAPGIVTGRSGTLGKIFYVKENFWALNTTLWVKDFHGNDVKFLYYFFKTFPFERYNSGSGVPTLNRNHIHPLPVKIPALKEQKSIADILSSFDDKIELLRAQNKTLETLAQTIFKEWFVKFNFPGATGEMIDSEFGDIPKGWNSALIKDLPIVISDFVANGSFASLKENVTLYQDKTEYALFIRNTDLKSNFKEKTYVDKHSYNFLKKTQLSGGEVIISNVGDVGSVFICPHLGMPMTLGNNIIMLKSKFNNFLYLLFSGYIGQHLIKGITGGSAQPKFNKTDFRSLSIIVPTEYILSEFESISQQIFDKITNNNSQIQTLEKTRDALLPKLMNGNIRVV
jgi:type I restriction enzyme, S subunit